MKVPQNDETKVLVLLVCRRPDHLPPVKPCGFGATVAQQPVRTNQKRCFQREEISRRSYHSGKGQASVNRCRLHMGQRVRPCFPTVVECTGEIYRHLFRQSINT